MTQDTQGAAKLSPACLAGKVVGQARPALPPRTTSTFAVLSRLAAVAALQH